MNDRAAGTTRWVIVIFLPPSDADEQVHRYRLQYDPLASHIAPHVTLVHPFVDDIPPSELRDHISRIADATPPFRMTLTEISPFPDGFIYLNVKAGNDAIIGLRDQLYTGPLARHKSRRDTFVPHVTIGRATDDTLDQAMRDADRLDVRLDIEASEISAYRFDGAKRRLIELTLPLGSGRERRRGPR